MATEGTLELATFWVDNHYLKFDFWWELLDQEATTSRIAYNIKVANIRYDELTDGRSKDVTSAISLDMVEVYINEKRDCYTSKAEIPKVKVNGIAKSVLEDDEMIVLTHSPDGGLSFEVDARICFDLDNDDWVILSGGTIDEIPDLLAIQAIPYRADNINDEENTYVKWGEVNTDYVASIEAAIMDDDEEIFIAEYREVDINDIRYDFVFTEEERKLLRQNIVGNDYTYFKAFLKTITTSGEILYDWKKFQVKLINAEPEINPEMYDINEDTIALTGNNKICINGYSQMYYNFNPVLKKEAKVKHCYINEDFIATPSDWECFNFTSSAVDFDLVDNRGLTAYKVLKLDRVVDYIPPTIYVENDKIDGNGNVNIRLFGECWVGNFGAVDNEIVIEYQYAVEDGEYCELIRVDNVFTDNSYDFTITLTGLDYKSRHNFNFFIRDKLAEYKDTSLIQSFPIFSWSKEDFEFNVPTTSMGYNLTGAARLASDEERIKRTITHSEILDNKMKQVMARLRGNNLCIEIDMDNYSAGDGVVEIGTISLDDSDNIINFNATEWISNVITVADSYYNLYFFKVDIQDMDVTITRINTIQQSQEFDKELALYIVIPVVVNIDNLV